MLIRVFVKKCSNYWGTGDSPAAVVTLSVPPLFVFLAFPTPDGTVLVSSTIGTCTRIADISCAKIL